MNELTTLLQSSPPIALAIGLNLLGLALKTSPIKNWLIPILLPVMGAAVYPFISEQGAINFQVKNPDALQAVYGFVIGAGSVGLNQMLRQFTGRKDENGDTQFIKKTETTKEEPKP
jgi:prepilin signal peptidase PulO-like enzyme (type II secretory pathway)